MTTTHTTPNTAQNRDNYTQHALAPIHTSTPTRLTPDTVTSLFQHDQTTHPSLTHISETTQLGPPH